MNPPLEYKIICIANWYKSGKKIEETLEGFKKRKINLLNRKIRERFGIYQQIQKDVYVHEIFLGISDLVNVGIDESDIIIARDYKIDEKAEILSYTLGIKLENAKKEMEYSIRESNYLFNPLKPYSEFMNYVNSIDKRIYELNNSINLTKLLDEGDESILIDLLKEQGCSNKIIEDLFSKSSETFLLIAYTYLENRIQGKFLFE